LISSITLKSFGIAYSYSSVAENLRNYYTQ